MLKKLSTTSFLKKQLTSKQNTKAFSSNLAPRQHKKKPAHHLAEGGFTNIWKAGNASSVREASKLVTNESFLGKMFKLQTKDALRPVVEQLPIKKPDFEVKDPSKVQLTWLGQAGFVVQMNGLNILTDPVFSKRASPVQFVGPKRIVPTPCTIEELPQIHAVLISHNHYDHLDYHCVKQLKKRFNPKFYVPLGVKDWFPFDIEAELDWWEHKSYDDKTKFVFLPSQHFSGRTLTDRNKSLWGSWLAETNIPSTNGGEQTTKKVYFAGDTGYCEVFKEIGDKHGPIDVALLPIGAYDPSWMMSKVHVNPEEAVQMSFDLKAKNSVGMHWATFVLTTEPILEPKVRLQQELKRRNLTDDYFQAVAHGETVTF